jgi:iron complex outermembrane recepter protein
MTRHKEFTSEQTSIPTRVGPAKPARLGVVFLLLSISGFAQQQDLTQLSLEDLSNLQVTSASKKIESLSGAPAAIFVLTGEDIRRGGFTTLPDALRMVPGLYVVQTNPHSWQVSARGFSDLNNNKMLVLVDGRSVYTPVHGGVYWDALDMPLQNIERIEVIRGPGGTLWGANAVNGVINIVSKSPEQTPGWALSTSADLDVGSTATVQYGGQAGHNVSYRVFGKSSYWEPFNSPSGIELPNNFNLSQAGGRADWAASGKDTISVEGGTYDGRFRSTLLFTPIRTTDLLKGNDLLVNWKHTISERSNIEVMSYCDWYARQGTAGEMRNRCDLEFQHSREFSKRHSLIWGGSFLSTGDKVTPDEIPVVPERRRNNVLSGFAQYEFVIVPDRLRILGGSKIEHNDYSGFENQPQVRAVWTPNPHHTVWSSASRAVRTPTRYESDLRLVQLAGVSNGVPFYLEVDGNPRLQSENVDAYEAGYRYQPKLGVSFDLALFYNDYGNLIATTPAAPLSSNDPLLHSTFLNTAHAQTHGAELSLRWKPLRHWELSPGVTELRGTPLAAQANPRHLFNVQSRVDLTRRLEFDSGLYYYSEVPLQANLDNALPNQEVPAFTRVDVGLAWHATSQWTLAVWGRNLQSDKHVESLDSILLGPAGEVPRSVVFKLLWQSKSENAKSK